MTTEVRLSLPEWIKEYSPFPTLENDEGAMRLALKLAIRNVKEKTGGPFSGVIYNHKTGEIISLAVNRVIETNCSAAHAEVMAILFAQQKLKTHDLSAPSMPDLTLVTNASPCVQCFGAIWWSGLKRVVYGATTEDVEEITGFCEGPRGQKWLHHLGSRDPLPSVEVIPEVLREDAKIALREYVSSDGNIYNPS